jgi:hypothetical protein
MAITQTSSPTTASAASMLPATAAPGMVSSNYGGPDINSVVLGLVDRRPWQYWDTFIWNLASPAVAIPSEVALFTVPINQLDIYTGLRKTKLQTNMTQSGQFPAPECLILQQIGIYICEGNTKAAIDQFFENCYMEFRINQKIFWEGQPWQFPAGVGYMGTLGSGTSTQESWTNGFPAPQATRRAGSFSKYIAPLQPFTVKFLFPGTPPTMATNFKLVVFLDGLADTVVQ